MIGRPVPEYRVEYRGHVLGVFRRGKEALGMLPERLEAQDGFRVVARLLDEENEVVQPDKEVWPCDTPS